MTRAEALQILGLSDNATEEDIRARWREQVWDLRPDLAGDVEIFERLNRAREVLLPSASAAMVPLDQAKDLVRIATADIERREAQQAAGQRYQSLESRLVRLRTTPLKEMRLRLLTISGLVGLSALVSQSLTLSTFESVLVSGGLGLTAVAGGAGALLYTQRIARIEGAIATVREGLDDRGMLIMSLREIWAAARSLDEDAGVPNTPSRLIRQAHGTVSAITPPPWTREAIEALVGHWFDHVGNTRTAESHNFRFAPGHHSDEEGEPLVYYARKIGVQDFTPLLVEKGVQHGILEPSEETSYGETLTVYAVTVPLESVRVRRRPTTNGDRQS